MNKKVYDELVGSVVALLKEKTISVATASVRLGVCVREVYKIPREQ